MHRKPVVTILIILISSIALQAQGIGIGPVLGIHRSEDAEGSTLMGGVALRLKLSPVLGVEGSIQYRQEKYAGDHLTVRSWPVMATGLIYPLPILYGAIGVGWYNTTFDYNQGILDLIEDTTDQQFGWHFGGGIELPIGPNAKLSGDIRYVFLDYDFVGIPGAGDLDSDFYVISIGLFFGL